ncbi:MAG: High potential iron-sulfur protein [Gammaproteobacteria bacterium]|nr:High potential iron-sulfur protein [Gammaproteobacteria bacterium]
MSNKSLTRRQFAAATVIVPLSAVFASREAAAQANLPKLDLNDPVAKALMYTHNAQTIDKGKVPNFKPGSNCLNCVQIQGAKAEWMGCTAFPGKLVSAQGWCSAWAPKPA